MNWPTFSRFQIRDQFVASGALRGLTKSGNYLRATWINKLSTVLKMWHGTDHDDGASCIRRESDGGPDAAGHSVTDRQWKVLEIGGDGEVRR
jgi:hypothetical protein